MRSVRYKTVQELLVAGRWTDRGEQQSCINITVYCPLVMRGKDSCSWLEEAVIIWFKLYYVISLLLCLIGKLAKYF